MRAPIFGFIHVMQVNHWRDILKEFTDQMEIWGLLQAAEKIFVGFVGTCLDHALPSSSKFIVASHYSELDRFEFPTLLKLSEICYQNPTARVFYMHTKGVTHPEEEGRQAWRRFMINVTVQQWQFCYWALNFYDAAGYLWMWDKHFHGNFWWANASYVRTLPDLCRANHRDRLEAEWWIGSAPQKRMLDVKPCEARGFSVASSDRPFIF